MIATLKHYLHHKKALQVGGLYSSMIISMILSILVSVINTRLLGPEAFGDFKFLQRIFTFTILFMTCGLFISGGRLLAQKKNINRRTQLTGALLICAAIIAIVFSSGLFCFSYFQDTIFDNNLGRFIRILSPLLFVYPLQLCLGQIMLGDNRIFEMSIQKIAPQLLYVGAAMLFHCFVPLSLISALAINFLSMAAVLLTIIFLIKPKFQNVKNTIRLIFTENKTNGFPVFIGSIAGVATAEIGGISIGYFMENTYVGFFALAVGITLPLSMTPVAVGTTFFKEFANKQSIPIKVTILTLIMSLFALIAYCLVIKQVVLILYSSEYAVIVPFTYYLAVGNMLHGFGDYYTRFLGAHGRGKAMRDSAIIVGICNILGYFILVKYYGVMGAVATRVTASSVYLLLRYGSYRNLTKKILLNSDIRQ